MNPHFIFNSLGSIQRFILEKESLEASEYLTDFASLMRLILESSNRSLVSLSDEIKSLNLYMKLENLRFNNAIKYTIDIDQSIDKNLFKIPPLLIQPILENSIWHGIMNNGGKGRIALTFSKDRRNLLHVMVSDDGIGIKKAEQIKSNKNKHISTGISNIKERISLLNEIYKSDMKVEIADLGSQGSELKGTRVSIFIYYRNDKY